MTQSSGFGLGLAIADRITRLLGHLLRLHSTVGRGTMFAVETTGIEPDILIMAKGIASGFPLSAIGSSAEIMAAWPTGSHGGTYGGNPIGCAAALATIEVLTSDGFLANVNDRGEQLRSGLSKLALDHPVIADVRGPGLMVAAEFRDPATGSPATARTAAIIEHYRTLSTQEKLTLLGELWSMESLILSKPRARALQRRVAACVIGQRQFEDDALR